jgi:hypothetical protein
VDFSANALLVCSWSPVTTHQVDLGASTTAIRELLNKQEKRTHEPRPDALRIYHPSVTGQLTSHVQAGWNQTNLHEQNPLAIRVLLCSVKNSARKIRSPGQKRTGDN